MMDKNDLALLYSFSTDRAPICKPEFHCWEDGQVYSVDDKIIAYSHDGNIQSIGGKAVKYNSNGQIASVGDKSVNYYADGEIQSIGGKTVINWNDDCNTELYDEVSSSANNYDLDDPYI